MQIPIPAGLELLWLTSYLDGIKLYETFPPVAPHPDETQELWATN